MSAQQKIMADAFIASKKQGTPFRLGGPGFLQTFAEKPDGDPGGEPDDDPEDDPEDDPDDDDPDDDLDDAITYEKGLFDQIMSANKLDFGQLLKDNPQLKKQYQTRFNKNMSKRLGELNDVDVDEYKDLKKRASEGKLESDAQDWKDKYESLQKEFNATTQRTAIQEVAIESKLDSEQIAFVTSMIKPDSIEQDDEGEWMGIEEEIERIQKKFPRMFDVKDSSDDDDDLDKADKKKSSRYNPGKKKHNSDSKGTDRKEKGKQRAMERHAKKTQ